MKFINHNSKLQASALPNIAKLYYSIHIVEQNYLVVIL